MFIEEPLNKSEREEVVVAKLISCTTNALLLLLLMHSPKKERKRETKLSCYLNPNWIETLNFGFFFPLSLTQKTLLSNISHLNNTKVGVVVAVVVIAQNQSEEKTRRRRRRRRRGKEIVRDRERALLYIQREWKRSFKARYKFKWSSDNWETHPSNKKRTCLLCLKRRRRPPLATQRKTTKKKTKKMN